MQTILGKVHLLTTASKFVYTPPAGYEGLYQEWSEYARSVLGYTQDQLAEATKKLAEQEPYVQLMRALIREWEPGATYNYGDIVQLNGMTYQAEANDVRLIAPDKADNTAVGVVWRPLVRIEPAKTLPEPEEPPVVMPIVRPMRRHAGPATQTAPIAVMTRLRLM